MHSHKAIPRLAAVATTIAAAVAFASFALLSAIEAEARWPPNPKPAASVRDQIDASLNETVQRVPVPGTDASIVVTRYRPNGAGPYPWIVLSHGSAPILDKNKMIGRYRNIPLVRAWVSRGYAVVVPVRRGYGDSGGEHLGDSYGKCERPDYRRAGEGAARDLLAAIDWAKTQRDLDPQRWLLVGQSAGGFASIYTASKQPAGLVAVLAFSAGRGGRPDTHPGDPCHQEVMAALYGSIAPLIKVPVLWFYAENDEYFGKRVPQLWFDAFRNAGGQGELVVIPPFPEARGHGVFPSSKGVPYWTAAVAGFYRHQKIDLPF